MQIFVKTTEGKTLTLEVESANTIGEVKKLISDKTGIPQNAFHLRSGTKPFAKEAATLQDCGIHKEQTLIMYAARQPVRYDEDVKPLLKKNILELIEQADSANTFILVCLGCYDHDHGDDSIKRQQCPVGLLEACRSAGYQLRILLVDSGFDDGDFPQIYDIDTNWECQGKQADGKVVRYKYADGNAQLFTFATQVLPGEYGGALLTLADVDLDESFPDKTKSCLVVGNFYGSTKPYLVKGDRSIADRFFAK